MAAISLPEVGEINVGPKVEKVAKCSLRFSGGDVNTGAVQATYALFNVPAGVLVTKLIAYTPTAWTASVTITIGDGTSAAGFLASADIAPTSAQTDGIPKSSISGAEAFANGRYYAAADTIDAVVAGANPAVGQTDIYLFYVEDVAGL